MIEKKKRFTYQQKNYYFFFQKLITMTPRLYANVYLFGE